MFSTKCHLLVYIVGKEEEKENIGDGPDCVIVIETEKEKERADGVWAYNCKLMIITLLYYYAVVWLSSTVYIRYKNYILGLVGVQLNCCILLNGCQEVSADSVSRADARQNDYDDQLLQLLGEFVCYAILI